MKINRAEFLMIMVCLIVIAIIGCGGGGGGGGDSSENDPSEPDEIKSEKKRIESPYISESESDELIAGNTEFALRLYHTVSEKNDENLFFSPYSISLAFAMIYAGAGDETETQIAETLCFTLSQNRLHPAFNKLDWILASRGGNENGFILKIANALWVQRDYFFLSPFLDVLAENYGAGLRLADFSDDPDDVRLFINNWVSENTEGKINNMLPKGSVSSDTLFILANAIYFKALWKFPFDEYETKNDFFYLMDGGLKNVPMMTQTGNFNYTQGDGCQAVELPYYPVTPDFSVAEEELSMVILLPEEERFTEVENRLTFEYLEMISENLESKGVVLTMPRFAYESELINLRGVLSKMGMPLAFSSDADFSGMDGTYDLFIGEAIHKAFISVDEDGTEAGAVTIIVPPILVPDDPITMTLNRPFIFFIRDIETRAILFLGRVMNPT